MDWTETIPMADKRVLDEDVLSASRRRISILFDRFDTLYVAFSGGKDSSVLIRLVADEARTRRRRFGALYVDLEAQYRSTVDHVAEVFEELADCCDPYWICLPIILRNASSQIQTKWMAWEPGKTWVRDPPKNAIIDRDRFPFFPTTGGMEFEEFVPAFGSWIADGRPAACLVGIRVQESLNRRRTLFMRKRSYESIRWTTVGDSGVVSAFPIYDWQTEDVWTYFARTKRPYNSVYDRMYEAGVDIHQMRICQPYGDDQRKGLWLYHVVEPDTWSRLVARVEGANLGASHAHVRGGMLDFRTMDRPPGSTWKGYARSLLSYLPPDLADHYGAKIWRFLDWYRTRGFPDDIPEEADPKAEAAKKAPSWRRVCKMILKNDFVGSTLSFGQHRSSSYSAYLAEVRSKGRIWR